MVGERLVLKAEIPPRRQEVSKKYTGVCAKSVIQKIKNQTNSFTEWKQARFSKEGWIMEKCFKGSAKIA
jgi:hypothetical protein